MTPRAPAGPRAPSDPPGPPDRSVPSEPSGEIHEAAHGYAARGWSVVPVEPRGKKPIVAWREFQQRIAERAEIDRWFRHRPDANVAIVTGRLSGLVVVDVDPRHGGSDSLASFEAAHGALEPTVEAATGGGGRHLYFRHPGTTTPNRAGLRPGIDVRGDGGCVVAPPSIHPSGRRYAWIGGRAPGEVPLASLPVALWGDDGPPRPVGHAPSHWHRLIHEGIPEGRRNDTVASLTGHLLQRGVDPPVALELMLAWNRTHCRPPLADDEVAAVVASIDRLRLRAARDAG